MDDIFYEIGILTKAVAYKNLTLASQNIGLSQPQLSRVVAKIEQHLKVSLLDRAARRKSGWTPEAFEVVNLYSKAMRSLKREIEIFQTGGHVKSLKIACLEGHVEFVVDWLKRLYEDLSVFQIEVGVFDTDQLEKKFLKGEFDLVLTSREIGKKKFQYSMVLGHQIIKVHGEKSGLLVMTPFEMQTKFFDIDPKVHKLILVSNSMTLRKKWIQEVKGKGTIPSLITTKKSSGNLVPVTLIAQDTFHPELWKEVMRSAKKVLH